MFADLAILSVAATAVLGAPAKRDDFSGESTFYATGLGNCGWQSQPSEYVVAMNAPQWSENGGTASGGGPCGRNVIITDKVTGKQATATVVDQCPTCAHGSLDMSEGLLASSTTATLALVDSPSAGTGRKRLVAGLLYTLPSSMILYNQSFL
jgi:hypothetical protein